MYRDFWRDKHLFDFSNYKENKPKFYDSTNEKEIGKMKDEAEGIPITEFVGLRSKMYSYIRDNETGDKKAKGIKKRVIKKSITHEDYKKIVFMKQQMRHVFNVILSKGHQVGSYRVNKISLSCFDDKRYILDDGITTLAHGHHRAVNKSPEQ